MNIPVYPETHVALEGKKGLIVGIATAASSLFLPDSLVPSAVPRFRQRLGEIQALFGRILEQTFGVSEGIWIGTPVNLTLERESRELEPRMAEISHPHLVVWGEGDGWIPPADLRNDGGGDAGRPPRGCARHRAFDESRNTVALRRLFGTWFGGLLK